MSGRAGAEHAVDVAVVGGGMVGLACASLLGRCGFSVALVEAGARPEFDPAAPPGQRVSALSPGSAAILEQAGAWRRVEQVRSSPYRRMLIEDGAGGARLEFVAAALGLERLGSIVENDLVRHALWQALEGNPLVRLCQPARPVAVHAAQGGLRLELDDGGGLHATLLVGADGAGSVVREWLGASQDRWQYNQRGLVCTVRKSEPNPGCAWQRFLPGGPLAFLPLADGASSIVWSLPSEEVDELLEADEGEFAAQLAEASAGWLGEVREVGPRAAFPLGMRLSDRCAGRGMVLLGDAAHVVHPLAGQGANLGLADAAALVETLLAARHAGRALADERGLRAFERWRRSESSLMAGGIHAIGALFRPEALAPVRALGLRAVARSWWLRQAFARRAAGLDGNAPRLSRGEGLAELLREGRGEGRR